MARGQGPAAAPRATRVSTGSSGRCRTSLWMNPKTVLVVDDHAPTRVGYAEFLRDCGYRVLEARHGGEAILRVQGNQPDVVLIDIVMPVLDGVETAQWLRRHLASAQTRILAVTACQSRTQQERMRAVCDDLLLKPCAPGVIAERIRSLVERAV